MPDQSEKDDACDKLEKIEKTPRKMLSRGETIDPFVLFKHAFFKLSFVSAWYWICLRGNTFAVTGSKICFLLSTS